MNQRTKDGLILFSSLLAWIFGCLFLIHLLGCHLHVHYHPPAETPLIGVVDEQDSESTERIQELLGIHRAGPDRDRLEGRVD